MEHSQLCSKSMLVGKILNLEDYMLRNKIIIAAMAIPFLVACGKSFVKEEPGSENVTIAELN